MRFSKKYALAIVDTCNKYNIDGFDYDIEDDGTLMTAMHPERANTFMRTLREEFDKNGLAGKVWQYFISVPDFKSVGVKDGKRYEGWPAIIRAINTTDAMTATIEEIPYPLLHHITDRITHEVPGINRVVYDLTPKPIGTIEFE